MFAPYSSKISLKFLLQMFLWNILLLPMSCGEDSHKNQAEDLRPEAEASPNTSPLVVKSLPSQSIEDLPLDLGALTNLESIATRLNLKNYHAQGYHGANLKIGIFDNGFAGLSDSLGKRLPPHIKMEKAFDPRLQVSSHGTKMAEMIYAATTGSVEFNQNIGHPELYLFNTNGFSNFKTAIDRAIELKLDMILYAQVWEFGGQFDGFGFINAEVSRATKAGIMWINASGNAGRSTYSGMAEAKLGGLVEFSKGADSLKIVVPQNQTPTKIVLSWGDFKDTKDYKTELDFDLILEDTNGKRIQESRLAQTGGEDTEFPGFSAHARESLETVLDSGIYYVKVQYAGGDSPALGENGAKKISFRVTATGMGLRMPDGTPDDSLPIPADHPDVLAIGASDVDYSGAFLNNNSLGTRLTASRRPKPDLWLESMVSFANLETTQPPSANSAADGIQATVSTINHYGTSAASALAVASIAVYQSAWGKTTSGDLVKACQKKRLTCKPWILPRLP